MYIYEGYNHDGEVVYIGKTNDPKNRLVVHKRSERNFAYLKILDIVVDHEQTYIQEYLSKGFLLQNRSTNSCFISGWEIGDIVDTSARKEGHCLKYKPTGEIFESGYKASLAIPEIPVGITALLKRSPNGKWSKLVEFV